MKTQLVKIAYVVSFGLSLSFAQDLETSTESAPEPELMPAIAAALPQPISVAQALASTSLPQGCVQDFTSLLEKDGFNMSKFMKELPPAVAKTKLQLKSPFGKPKDSDKTNVGLTVGCIKALPDSPAEITSLLKDISLKAGLDLVVETAENLVENSIPTNIPNEIGSEGGWLKPISSISLATMGLAAIIYGITQNNEVSNSVDRRDGKAAVDAESRRNMSYGIGAGLLAGGLIVYLVF